MKNSFFSNFDCDPEIMRNDCNITVISGKFHLEKHYGQFFFLEKKIIPSDIPKWWFSDFMTEPETPFGIRNFIFPIFNLFVYFFGVKYTGNYHVIGIIA